MIFRMSVRHLSALFLAAVVSALSLVHAAKQKAPDAVKRGGPVASGDIAPDFTLTDQNGRKHTLSAERGKRPVVLVFYRGYW